MLAIVIPFFKLTFFEETLISLTKQTNKNFSLYIGNDCSPDNPELILTKYESELQFTYRVFENNLGGKSLTKHWDRCINMTNDEEWIMILGDDDLLGANVIEAFYKQHPIFNEESNVVRFSSAILKANSLSKVFKHPKFIKPEIAYCKKVFNETRSSLSEHIFRKKSYDAKGFVDYPLAWCSDDRAWLDFSDETKSIYSINEALVTVRISNVSISGDKKTSRVKQLTEKKFRLWFYNNKGKFLSKKDRLKYLYILEELMKMIDDLTRDEWVWFYKSYLDNFSFIAFIKLNRRFIINLLK